MSTGVVHMQSVDTPRASASDEAGSEGVFGPGHQAKVRVWMRMGVSEVEGECESEGV